MEEMPGSEVTRLRTGWLEMTKANRAGTQGGEGRRWHSSQLCIGRYYTKSGPGA